VTNPADRAGCSPVITSSPRFSPVVSLYPENPGEEPTDPLGDYLDSLERIAALAPQEILPAHQYRFTDAPARGTVSEAGRSRVSGQCPGQGRRQGRQQGRDRAGDKVGDGVKYRARNRAGAGRGGSGTGGYSVRTT